MIKHKHKKQIITKKQEPNIIKNTRKKRIRLTTLHYLVICGRIQSKRIMWREIHFYSLRDYCINCRRKNTECPQLAISYRNIRYDYMCIWKPICFRVNKSKNKILDLSYLVDPIKKYINSIPMFLLVN